MNAKIKILLIALAAICVMALVIAFHLNGLYKTLSFEYETKTIEFENERTALTTQLRPSARTMRASGASSTWSPKRGRPLSSA